MTRADLTPSLSLQTAGPRRPLIAALAVRFARVIRIWAFRRRSRIHLGELDAHLLNDIGLTAAQAKHESKRPFWRA